MDIKENLIWRAIITLFFLMFINSVSFGQSLKLIPESEYVEFLDRAAASMKANYDKIDTWQGEFSIEEDNYFYGEQCTWLNIDANDPASRSEAIRSRIYSLGKFETDVKNNKLYYSESKPEPKYKALDLQRDFTLKEMFSPIISIVTPDGYLSFKPNFNYGYGGKKVNEKWSGRQAFRLPLEKTKNEQWSDIRDPRKYFSEGHKMFWEDLEVLSNLIANPAPDIPEGKAPRIGIFTEGTKTYIKTRFYRSEDCNSCDPNLEFVNINLILDNSIGYNAIRREALSKNNEILNTLDIAYENIDGIFIPKSVHFVISRSSDFKKSFDSKITFTKSILNAPIPEETFTHKNLGLKEGEVFRDEIQKKRYKYEDASLVFVSDVLDRSSEKKINKPAVPNEEPNNPPK